MFLGLVGPYSWDTPISQSSRWSSNLSWLQEPRQRNTHDFQMYHTLSVAELWVLALSNWWVLILFLSSLWLWQCGHSLIRRIILGFSRSSCGDPRPFWEDHLVLTKQCLEATIIGYLIHILHLYITWSQWNPRDPLELAKRNESGVLQSQNHSTRWCKTHRPNYRCADDAKARLSDAVSPGIGTGWQPDVEAPHRTDWLSLQPQPPAMLDGKTSSYWEFFFGGRNFQTHWARGRLINVNSLDS